MAPLTDLLLLDVAVGLALLAALVGAVTLLQAVRFDRRDRRNEAVRDRLRGPLLERLFADEPGWEAWVGDLSGRERRQLRVLLADHLRKLRGTEHARLCDLARVLGVQREARRNVAAGRDLFQSLTWLALLKEPVDPAVLESTCTDTRTHRAAAARVLHASDHPQAGTAGTDLLLGEGDEPLSAFGLDTLYRLNEGAETPLLPALSDPERPLAESVLVQALVALRYCHVDQPAGRFEWLPALLGHDSPRVRAAAVGTLERHGWRAAVRDRVDVEALLADPEPSVRYDTYLLLAAWGTEASAGWIRTGFDAPDDREVLTAVRALFVHPRAELPDAEGRVGPFVEWVRADAAVSGPRNRVWGVGTAWS